MKRTSRLTRRQALHYAGGALAGAAVLPTHAIAADAPHPVTLKLAEYMATAGAKSLPADAVEHAKHHILDTFAAMISGCDLPPGRVALKFAAAHNAEKVATIAASRFACSAMDAAMVNGMLAHSDETDDTHAPSHSHPGCSIVPAALAAGEQFGVDGTRFLRSVTLGYDIGTRITSTLGALKYQMETHRSTHSIASDFGASAAAGCAAGLDEHQMRWLLDYAAQQASGIVAWQRDTEHVEKSLVFGGFPARNGVAAALLIQLGGSGVEDVFTGTDNFLLAFGAKNPLESLTDKLGERFEVTRTSIKKWTVGSPIQAVLDSIYNLQKKQSFAIDQVEKVTVRVASSEANTVNNRDMPDICLQHMAAIMLIDKTASFAAAHDKPRMKDPGVLKQRAKVQLVFDEELEKLIPRRIAVVEIAFTNGTKLTERVEAVRGSAENPMGRDEVVTKAIDLVTPVIGASKASQLADTVLNIEKVKNIGELRPLLQVS
ncbi:MAG: MmgE/PrpD family protein [Bryobacteraceae bacterium]